MLRRRPLGGGIDASSKRACLAEIRGKIRKNPGRAWLRRDNQMRKEGLEPSHPVWKQVPETCASTISPLSLLSCVTFRQRATFYTYDLYFATFFYDFFYVGTAICDTPCVAAIGVADTRRIRRTRRADRTSLSGFCVRLCAVGAYVERARVTTRAYHGHGYRRCRYAVRRWRGFIFYRGRRRRAGLSGRGKNRRSGLCRSCRGRHRRV